MVCRQRDHAAHRAAGRQDRPRRARRRLRGRCPRDIRQAAHRHRQPRVHPADQGHPHGGRAAEARRLRLPQPRRLHGHRRLREEKPRGGDDRRRPARPGGGPQHDGARLRVACGASRRPSHGDAARCRMGGGILKKAIEDMASRSMSACRRPRCSGDDKVTGLAFKDGSTLACDLVIVAAGIRPNSRRSACAPA